MDLSVERLGYQCFNTTRIDSVRKLTFHIPVQTRYDSMTRKLFSHKLDISSWISQTPVGTEALTPDIINPRQSGNFFQSGSQFVFIGCHKLPGAVVLIVPSAMITDKSTIDDKIPKREVKDSSRRGRKVVGTILVFTHTVSIASINSFSKEREREGEKRKLT